MNKRQICVFLTVLTVLSLSLLLFAPRIFQAVGVFLLGITAASIAFSVLRMNPAGWNVTEADAPFSLFHKEISGICLDEDLLKGALKAEGDLILPGGTYPVSRIRSLPGGVLLCAALAATYSHTRNADDIASLFPEMSLDPEQFDLRFPLLRTLRLSSVTGQVVQDGPGERVFFNIESTDPACVRMMHLCRLIQTGGKVSEIEEGSKKQLLDLPDHTMVLFTGVPQGNQVNDLTFLGALSLRQVQCLNEAVLSDIHHLESDGLEVFLAYPMQSPKDTVLPPTPVPIHEAGPHTATFVHASEETPFLPLREAANQLLQFRQAMSRLFAVYAGFALAVAVLAFLSGIHMILSLPLLALPLIFPFMMHAHPLHTAPSLLSSGRVTGSGLILLMDGVLMFLLVFLTENPLWQQTVIFHALVLSCAFTVFLIHACIPLQFSSARSVPLLLVCALLLAVSAWFICGPEGIFTVLLAVLSSLMILLCLGAV